MVSQKNKPLKTAVVKSETRPTGSCVAPAQNSHVCISQKHALLITFASVRPQISVGLQKWQTVDGSLVAEYIPSGLEMQRRCEACLSWGVDQE